MAPKHIFLGVTGNPVLHSKSPLIFNYLFSRMNIDNSFYTRLASDSAEESIYLFKRLNLSGMNVTAPFKENIMGFLDETDEDAKIIGGVNTVVNENMKLKGYNTDYLGVINSINKKNIELKNRKVLVLGAGGAGKGAIYGLIKSGAGVMVANRTIEKAKKIADSFNCSYTGLDNLNELLKEYEIVISTLSADIDIIDEKWLNPSHIIFDANYKYSPLIEKGIRKGCQIIRGEEWLVNQALPAFGLFLKKDPPQDFNYDILSPQNNAVINFFLLGLDDRNIIIAKKLSEALNIGLFDFNNDILQNQNKKIIPINDIDSLSNDTMLRLKGSSVFFYLFNEKKENLFVNFKNSTIIINGNSGDENKIAKKIEAEIIKTF